MSVTTAPVTSPEPVPATLSGTVLLAVKAEVAAAAAATATPASRRRDLRIAGGPVLSGSDPPPGCDHPAERRLRHSLTHCYRPMTCGLDSCPKRNWSR